MILDLLANKDCLRVLRAAEKRPMRFVLLEQELALNPARVDRALKLLCKERCIQSVPADTATGRFVMVYRVTRRGAAFLAAHRGFTADLERRLRLCGA